MRPFAIMLCVIALAACSGTPAAPGEVATAFARKWDGGDCSGIGGLVTGGSGLVAGGVEQACTARIALRQAPPKQISEIKVTEAREDGDRAVVRLETRYADGSAQAGEPIVLVRQDGGWRVDLLATGASRMRGLLTREAPPAPAPDTKAAPGNIV